MPGHTDKKNGKKANGKKKVLPVKPPSSRRGMSKKQAESTIRNVTKKIEPNDAKLARKIMTEPSFRKKLGNAFLTGLTFGLYKP